MGNIGVNELLTKIYDAESVTNWSDSKAELFSEINKEGTYCIGISVSEEIAYNYKTLSSINLTNTHLYTWLMQWGNYASQSNGGYRIVLGDGTNTRGYYIGGSDNSGFPEGTWNSVVLSTADLSNLSFDQINGSGAPNLSAITQVGYGFNCLSKAVGGAINSFGDICWYGEGLNIYSGTAANPITFEDIYQYDVSSGAEHSFGIIHNIGGNYFLQGKLVIGSSSSMPTYFKDTNKTITFADVAVSSNLYRIDISGALTIFQLGNIVSNAGVEGCIIQQAGSSLSWRFDAASNIISGCNLYGTTFIGASEVKLPYYNSGVVWDCSFNDCNMIEPNTCSFKRNNIISSRDIALLMVSGHNISDTSIISCPSGIKFTDSGYYTLDNIQFLGCNYDLVNATASGWISAQCVNGTNASSYINTNGGTTTIINSVYLTVNVEDEAGDPIVGAQTAIYSGSTALMNKDTDANGQAQVTYNYTGDTPITVRIRKSSPGDTRYIPYNTTGVITSDGYSLTAVLIEDSIV